MSAGPGSWSFRNPFVTMFDRQYGNKSDRAAGGSGEVCTMPGDSVVKQKINKLSNSVHSLPSFQLKMKTQLFNLSSLNNNSKINEKYNNLEFAS